MAHLVSPRQDVALRRPGWSRSVRGLPEGRLHWGAFLWWLSLCKQRKLLARSQLRLVRSVNLKTGETMPPSLNGWWAFSPVLTPMLRCQWTWLRASYFSCSCKKSNQKNTPQGVALRASREQSAYGKAVPKQHPCCDGTKQAIHGLFTSPTAIRSRRPHTGKIKSRAFGRDCN